MRTLLSPIIAATLAASFAMAIPVPANAAPVYVPNAAHARTDVQPVRHTYRHWLRQQRRAELRAERRAWRRQMARERCYRWGDCYRERYYGFAPRYHERPYYGRRDYYRRPGLTLEFGL